MKPDFNDHYDALEKFEHKKLPCSPWSGEEKAYLIILAIILVWLICSVACFIVEERKADLVIGGKHANAQ